MAQASNIEWTQATWNPIAGCQIVSPGCTNCYAMKMAARHEAMSTAQGRVSPYAGLTRKTKAGAVWNGEMRLVESALRLPLTWRKPRTIFVNSMSDLFAEGVPESYIDQIFAVMIAADRHTYQVLTKRPDRMRDYLGQPGPASGARASAIRRAYQGLGLGDDLPSGFWFKQHIWLGASAEDQPRLDQRLPALLDCSGFGPRFLSLEPFLGQIDLDFRWDHCDLCGGTGILGRWPKGKCHVCNGRGTVLINGEPRRGGYRSVQWVIVGGESGPGSRACWVPDVRSIVRQCTRVGVPVFVKQLGADVQDRNDAGFDGLFPHHWPDMDPADVEHDLKGFRDGYQGAPVRVHLRDRKGADTAEWPEDLRFRQSPEIAHG